LICLNENYLSFNGNYSVGYRLALFDVNKYKKTLSTQWLGQSLSYFKELDSTNTYMKGLPANQVSHGQLCLADRQHAGRGQYNRDWETESGKNLTFTLAFRPSSARRFHILTLVCARAAVAEIEDRTDQRAYIKWPNDIIIRNKKVAGLLTETVFNGNELDRLLIGIGLNVNQEAFTLPLRDKAVSLKQVLRKEVCREEFLCRFLSRIEFEYTRWHKQNDELLKFINKKIIGYGRWIKINVNGHLKSEPYKLLGINQKGQLTVITKEGDVETFSHEQINVITD